MGAGSTVDPRAADRNLHPFVARRLRINPRLVSQHILIAGHAALKRAAHVDHVAAAGHLRKPRRGLFDRQIFATLILSPDQHLPQLNALGLDHGWANEGQPQ
ncbi:hypothetical protein D3C86_1834260 [compost metagenome]